MPDCDVISTAASALADRVMEAARVLTRNGEAIDDHQVVVDRVAYVATEARVIAELARLPGELAAVATVAAAELAAALPHRLAPIAPALGLGLEDLRYDDAAATAIATGIAPEAVEAIGIAMIASAGRQPWPLDEMLGEVRSNVRAFAEREIMPHAEHIHHHDELVPERFITEMAKLGYFGLSVPEKYGGHELGNLAMILTTEELSRASLAAAGSLITRPEILAKALLAGGTEEQKQTWLPRLASGEIMAAISVTEPNTGSDVASVSCRAERAPGGWTITGAKAWCTFAGRADVIALLARTGEPSEGARGLTLFIVDKPRFLGHELEASQPGGGTLSGKADRTPGYRGMHSFTLAFDRWLVPDAQVVGGEAGLGRGFALQMAGFAAGRLQTGGRACGVTQAAVEHTAKYVAERKQFGRPIGDFGLTRYHLGRMASRLAAARAITYAAAAAMDGDERAAAPLAAMAKLFACDVAVEVTQLGQLLHGGWGYAEEYPISRCVTDAQVLPIFEGVKPILALKVIGRSILTR
ncbi:MAG: acyl-CoA dehydrogenase family protein [Deltaproteobacteria bacterium]|nr:acyl-CoA dehydrogenase family protein [Deltaproteobacteria bacterium]MDQ3297002.1 acyl-CoA dehydrogenase family protein [Myxococcota bacterium]